MQVYIFKANIFHPSISLPYNVKKDVLHVMTSLTNQTEDGFKLSRVFSKLWLSAGLLGGKHMRIGKPNCYNHDLDFHCIFPQLPRRTKLQEHCEGCSAAHDAELLIW